MTHLHPRQILYLAEQVLVQTGDALLVRDAELLESAVYRPQAGFGGREFYPDLFSKAAAMGFSLIRNHPFLDGNKRVGYAAMDLLLELNGFRVHAADRDKINLALDIAKGEINEENIAAWLKKHSKHIEKTSSEPPS